MHRAQFQSTLLCLLLLAMPVAADPPASLAEGSSERASLERYAETFLERLRHAPAADRARLSLRPGADGPIATYRAYGDDYQIELRTTGHPAAPWFGILRYTEQTFSCRDLDAQDCALAGETPLAEIFRYRQGRWGY
jgi:hypothetical protein